MIYKKLFISGLDLYPLIQSSYESVREYPLESKDIILHSEVGFIPHRIDLLLNPIPRSFMGRWNFSYWDLHPMDEDLPEDIKKYWEPENPPITDSDLEGYISAYKIQDISGYIRTYKIIL